MIHQKRREELLSMLGRDAVVIVSTNSEQKRNSDVTYPFRPDSNFWYLTGFTEPDAIAVFSKESYVMFLRPKDETKEIWNGIRLGVALAPETLLVDQAYDIDTFFDNIDSFTQKRSVIYFDAPGSGGWKDNSSTNIHNQRIHSLFERQFKALKSLYFRNAINKR
jgi:Xaa-Pro aminopeptidase